MVEASASGLLCYLRDGCATWAEAERHAGKARSGIRMSGPLPAQIEVRRKNPTRLALGSLFQKAVQDIMIGPNKRFLH